MASRNRGSRAASQVAENVGGTAIFSSFCRPPYAMTRSVATPSASFRTPEAQRGSVGATQRLPRILGKRLAKDLMFTGRAMTAEEARTAGLVARVVDDLHKEATLIGEAILKASPLAMKLAKRTIDRGIELDPKGALQAEIEAIEEQLAAGQWMGKT